MKTEKPLLNASNMMLATVLVLLLLATVITMGMLTPLVAKLASGVEISLGPQYFNDRAAIPTAVLVLLLSTCMLAGYTARKNITLIVAGSAALTLISAILSPFGNIPMDISVPILAVATITTFHKIARSWNRDHSKTIRGISAHLIHLGILFILLGIVLSSNMKVEDSQVLNTGDMAKFEGQKYEIMLKSMSSQYQGEPYQDKPASSYTTDIDFDIYKNGKYFKTGQVKYITDFKWGQTYTTTYIHRGLTEELFIAPRAIEETKGELDVYMRTVPFINFLWGGMYLMVIGIIALGIIEYRNDSMAPITTSIAGNSGKGTRKQKPGKLEAEERYDELLEKELEERRAMRRKQ
ncbi:cytochrome c-type biogenesis CcmF C-terminal domain-containing protein [Methanolobus sp. ZRKC3]|uniref:cytochrome c-type biogenesis CcmF C-terminal domain-containing protein n=1 Tax=Methanolobus sp. ZRKC3 TaxID=3125786 RepID=UPI0032542891